MLQAHEMARGEEVIKNDSSVIMRSGVYNEGSGTESSKENYEDDMPRSGDNSAEGEEMKKMLDKQRRDELQEIMRDKSLDRNERKAKMDEVRNRYDALAEDLGLL
jgi:hypothetical protein